MISIDKVVKLVECSDQVQFLESDSQHDSVLNLHLAKPLPDDLYQWLTALDRNQLFELVERINIRAGYYNHKVTKFDITQTRMVEFDAEDKMTVDGEMYVTFHLLPKGTRQMTDAEVEAAEALEEKQPEPAPPEPGQQEEQPPVSDDIRDDMVDVDAPPSEPEPQPDPEPQPEPEPKPEQVKPEPPSNPNEVVQFEGDLVRTSVYGHQEVTWDKVTPDKNVCAIVGLELAYNLDKEKADSARSEASVMGVVPFSKPEEVEDTSDWFLLKLRTAYKTKEGSIKWNAKEDPILVPKRYIVDSDKKRVFGLVKIESSTAPEVDLYLTQTIIDDLCLSFGLNLD